MSLRKKTLLIIGATLAVLLAVVNAVLTVLPLDSSATLELGRAIDYLRLVIAASSVAYIVILLVLLERLVLSRLARLSSDVWDVAASGDPSLRVRVSGRDELAGLAATINGMLQILERAQTALRESEGRYRAFNEELEIRVGERTAALEATNARLAAEVAERTRAERMQAVAYRIADVANRETILVHLLRTIRQELSAIIDTTNFYIALHNRERGMLHFPYYVDQNFQPAEAAPSSRVLGRGLTEYVLRTGQPLLATNADIYALNAQGEIELLGPECVIWLGVPLVSDGTAIGVVAVQSYSQDTTYTQDDLELLRFVSGQIAGAIARLQRDEVLRQQSAAMAASIDGIAVLDAQGECVYLNDAQARMHGYDSPSELVGKSWLEVYGVDAQARFEGEILPALKQRRQWRGEMMGRRRDGSTFPQEVSLSSVRGIGLVAVVRDITERQRLEEQFLQAQKMEAIGQLAGGVAHDFNNLLTAISGYATLVRDALPAGDPSRDDIAQVLAATDRAGNLTRQLLTFSRRHNVTAETVNLNDIILGLGKMLRRLIHENIELETIPAADLGSIRADPGQIEQVITNLVVNAGDAMPDGGRLTIETARVTLDAEYARQHMGVIPGDYCMLAVSDTGCGMTEEIKARIFEPFYTTKDPGKGTGLGLATCYGIVRQSGGHIWVYSEPGKGTTFKIYLPRIVEAAVAKPRREAEIPRPRGTQTVLLVEDEPAVRGFASRVLREMGYTVLEASNGTEALDLAAENAHKPVHLLLTDIVMPQMGGEKLAQHLKGRHPQMKVLYVSGYTANAVVHQGVLDDGVAFLQKPFTIAGLAQKVRDVLES